MEIVIVGHQSVDLDCALSMLMLRFVIQKIRCDPEVVRFQFIPQGQIFKQTREDEIIYHVDCGLSIFDHHRHDSVAYSSLSTINDYFGVDEILPEWRRIIEWVNLQDQGRLTGGLNLAQFIAGLHRQRYSDSAILETIEKYLEAILENERRPKESSVPLKDVTHYIFLTATDFRSDLWSRIRKWAVQARAGNLTGGLNLNQIVLGFQYLGLPDQKIRELAMFFIEALLENEKCRLRSEKIEIISVKQLRPFSPADILFDQPLMQIVRIPRFGKLGLIQSTDSEIISGLQFRILCQCRVAIVFDHGSGLIRILTSHSRINDLELFGVPDAIALAEIEKRELSLDETQFRNPIDHTPWYVFRPNGGHQVTGLLMGSKKTNLADASVLVPTEIVEIVFRQLVSYSQS